VRTQKLDADHQPLDDAGKADAGISRLRSVGAQLAIADLDITVHTKLEPLESDWRALEKDPLASLHQGYEWCRSWVRAYDRPLAVLKGTAQGKAAFILPIEIENRHGVRIAKFIGADHSNINTGLFALAFAENGDKVDHQRLAAHLRAALAGKADLLLLQNIPLEWRDRRNMLAGLCMVQNQNHAYQLPLLDTFEKTLQQLNAKSRRKKFRAQSRRLEAIGGFDYIAPETSAEQHELLEKFFHLKSARFASLGLPDVFADAETKAFLHGLIDAGNGDNFGLRMRALRLKGDYEGRIAALSGISRKGDHVICQFGAIDEDLVADASPGEFLFWQMISGLHGKEVALFDFGLGDQTYKRSWAPVETDHYDMVLPISGIGIAAGTVHRAITRGKAFIKARPGLYKFAQNIRAKVG